MRWGSLCFKEIPTCNSGFYSFFNNTWSCQACPPKCSECIYYKDSPICRSCAEGFYKTISNAQAQVIDCSQMPTNNTAGTYYFISTLTSQPDLANCPAGCSTCKARDIYVQNSVLCLTCATGFVLNNSRCIRTTPNCDTGSYSAPLTDNSGYVCVKCPSSCATCGFLNASSITSEFTCNSCANGF